MTDSHTYSGNSSQITVTGQQNGNQFALVSLTTLFFMWGFITCLNDILIPYLKGAFSLSYTQAMMVQFCFFGAYFIVSLPAGALVAKIGYQRGIVTGLTIASIGCLLFYPAAQLGIYAVFLLALFVLASGITILQVSANPYVNVLGPEKTAPARLTLTQAFNSLGTTVAPFFGAWLIFSEGQQAAQGPGAVQTPYLILAAMLIMLAAIFAFLTLPKLTTSSQIDISPSKALKFRHLKLGAFAIFAYVGAEVAIGSFLVNFLHDPKIAGLSEAQASRLIAYYWGGAMVGRFAGAFIMRYIPGARLLAFNTCMAVLLTVVAMITEGSIAMWSILLVGLFNSIMFPTIFSLSIIGLGKATSHGAGVLCLAIVGGAIVPLVQGFFADTIGVQLAFFVPVICYFYILFFALRGYKPVGVAAQGDAQ